MDLIWTILMLQILQAHLFRAFVVNLKLVAIFALCPESFCDKNLAALAERTVAILTSIVKIPHLIKSQTTSEPGTWHWGCHFVHGTSCESLQPENC